MDNLTILHNLYVVGIRGDSNNYLQHISCCFFFKSVLIDFIENYWENVIWSSVKDIVMKSAA